MLFELSSICMLGPNPISNVQEAGWTLTARETKVGSKFQEFISKTLVVFVLYESHKVMCSTYWKGNGDSSKSRMVFFPHFDFPLMYCLELFVRGLGQEMLLSALNQQSLAANNSL